MGYEDRNPQNKGVRYRGNSVVRIFGLKGRILEQTLPYKSNGSGIACGDEHAIDLLKRYQEYLGQKFVKKAEKLLRKPYTYIYIGDPENSEILEHIVLRLAKAEKELREEERREKIKSHIKGFGRRLGDLLQR